MTRIYLVMFLSLTLLVPTAWAEEKVQSQLEALKLEPTVRQVQEAALRYFRVNLNTVNSMRRRASWKAIVPVAEVSGGLVNSTSDENTWNREKFFNDEKTWLSKGAGGDSYEIRGKLSWNLPQLIFNPEELDVASLAGLMEGILKESTRLYFMRRRLQVDMILSPPTDRASLLSKQLRLEELSGLIDAMTGGWFQQELAASISTNQRKANKPIQKQASTPLDKGKSVNVPVKRLQPASGVMNTNRPSAPRLPVTPRKAPVEKTRKR